MRMTTQQVLYDKTASIMHEQKPSTLCVCGMEQCLVCGNIADWITNAHAVRHGYKNRREMANDGKIMSRSTGRVLKCSIRVSH